MSKKGKTLLIAEDDPDVKYVYHLLLERSDYQLINAHNGQEAVDQYKACRPDLVIMDILMPIKNGEEAIKEILEYDPMARIIAITAFKYSEGQLGVPILRKGFRKQELLEMVEYELAR